MKPIEEIDVDKLVEVCKQMNEVIEEKIEVVGVATTELIEHFTVAIESMTEEQQDKVPEAVEMYNDIYKDEAVGPSKSPAQKEPEKDKEPKEPAKGKGRGKKKGAAKKASGRKKKEKEPKPPKEPKEKDEFGFTVGTKNNQFIEAIKGSPMTMKEIKDQEWNEKNVTFYEIFKKLKAAGKVDKDEEGRMFVK